MAVANEPAELGIQNFMWIKIINMLACYI
jgi:hypothetical protein